MSLVRLAAGHRGRRPRAVGEPDLDLLAVLDDVQGGEDGAVGVDDDARAEGYLGVARRPSRCRGAPSSP